MSVTNRAVCADLPHEGVRKSVVHDVLAGQPSHGAWCYSDARHPSCEPRQVDASPSGQNLDAFDRRVVGDRLEVYDDLAQRIGRGSEAAHHGLVRTTGR